MTWKLSWPEHVVELGRGGAREPARDLFGREAVKRVRYADRAAWTTAAAVARAVAPVRQELVRGRDRVGVVVTSAHGPSETLAVVARDARDGYGSPLRYPAASPGSLVGVCCILFGFRGPTLNLLMRSCEGVAAAGFAAGRWLAGGAAGYMVVAVCVRLPMGNQAARALVLADRTERPDATGPEGAQSAAWLAACPDGGDET